MARRIYFAFHFDKDILRVNQVRMSNVVAGVEKAGFFDHSEYEEVKKKSPDAIARAIRSRLDGTTVTVVLIGRETAVRDWVRFEIAESVARGNGLFGVYIHHLDGINDPPAPFNPLPLCPGVPHGIEFTVFKWDGNLNWFSAAIEAAGQRADQNRRLAQLYPTMFRR